MHTLTGSLNSLIKALTSNLSFNFSLVSLDISTLAVQKLLSVLAIIVSAGVFILVLALFKNFVFKYKNLVFSFFVFIVLYIFYILLQQFIGVNFPLMHAILIIFLFILIVVYVYTKHEGYLSIDILVFLDLLAVSFILYGFVPVFYAITSNISLPDTYLNFLTWVLVFLGLSSFIYYAFYLMYKNYSAKEVAHLFFAGTLFLIVALIKYFHSTFAYYEVFIWFLYATVVEGVIEFATHYPSLQKVPYFKGAKKWLWIGLVILVGGLVI